jgi:hypothetical protein
VTAPRPTLGELVSEGVQELVNLDGKILTTLRLLVTRPGLLTSEVLSGRRARYITPLRLYITCSLLYFFVAAVLPSEREVFVETEGGPQVGTKVLGATVKAGITTDSARRNSARPTADTAHECVPDTTGSAIDRRIELAACRAHEQETSYGRALLSNQPRMMFVLLPLYAAILAIFWRRRTYPEHLYFALHLHSFVFLALLAGMLARLLPIGTGPLIALRVAIGAWVVVYSVLALRQAYGDSMGKTIAKSLGVGFFYLVAFALAMWSLILLTLLTF